MPAGTLIVKAMSVAAALWVTYPSIAQAADGRALPKSMIGYWGWSPASCLDRDDGRVEVKPKRVDFFASGFAFKSKMVHRDGTISARAIVHNEGEPDVSESTIAMKVLAPDRLSIKIDDGEPHVYIRCRRG